MTISHELRELASGPAAMNPENTDAINLILRAAETIEKLKRVAHEQTLQTLETNDQIRQLVLDAIDSHGGRCDVVGLGHPIEQIVGTLLAHKNCEIEELRGRAVTWIRVTDRLPDDDTIVLVYAPNAASEPVWLGYLDGEDWHWANGMRVGQLVSHWAEMPEGPKD